MLLWLLYYGPQHQNSDEQPNVVFGHWLPLPSTRQFSLRRPGQRLCSDSFLWRWRWSHCRRWTNAGTLAGRCSRSGKLEVLACHWTGNVLAQSADSEDRWRTKCVRPPEPRSRYQIQHRSLTTVYLMTSLQTRQNHHFRISKQFRHLTRHRLNLRFLVYVSHSTCWRRETRTATNECGKSFCRHPQTSTCVTVLWDAGSPTARWTLRRCRVWHAIKRLLAVVPRSAMYKLLHPPCAWQRLLCKSTVPERTRAYRFQYKNSVPGYLGLTAREVNHALYKVAM